MSAQCPAGDFATLNSQADVNAFGTNFPTCTSLEFLEISGTDITDLSPLSNLATIATMVVEENDNLVNLNGLGNFLVEQLTVRDNFSLAQLSTTGSINVTSNLIIRFNPSLINFQGLEGTTNLQGLTISDNSFNTFTGLDNLTNVTNSTEIQNNSTVENFTGLGNFSYSRSINVRQNENLQNLNGLVNFSTQFFEIRGNTVMTEISTTSDIEVTSVINILYNPSLNSLDGLGTTTSLESVDINYNDIQSLVGLDNLATVSSYITITDNTSLIDLTGLGGLTSPLPSLQALQNQDLINLNGLPDMTFDFFEATGNAVMQQMSTTSQFTVNISIQVNFNASLVNLQGLESTTVINELFLSNNDIQSFSGLDNLTTITSFTDFSSNTSLTNFSGLGSLETVGSLSIVGNPDLLNLNGMGNVTTPSFRLESHDILSTVSTTNQINVTNNLNIHFNGALENLVGLEPTVALEEMVIDDNVGFISFNGLENLETVSSLLIISNNPDLPNLNGLSGLQSSETLFVQTNSQMTSLDGIGDIEIETINISGNQNLIQPLTTGSILVTNQLAVVDNPAIQNLNGFETTMNLNEILLSNNALLTNIEGLANAIELQFVQILNNTTLSDCSVLSLCNAIGIGDTNFNLEGNATGCNTVQEVTTGCDFDCPLEDVILNSQAEINQFAIDFPDCTEIFGSLKIDGDDVIDLTPLAGIESIRDGLTISNNHMLTTLNGLNIVNLDYDEQSLNLVTIQNNNLLADVSAMSSVNTLTNVANEQIQITIDDNLSLSNLIGIGTLCPSGCFYNIINTGIIDGTGLEPLVSPDHLVLNGNNLMENLSGFDNLDTVKVLVISGADLLTNFDEFENVSVTEDLTVQYNDNLVDLERFLRNGTNAVNYWVISNNPSLSTCNVNFFCEALAEFEEFNFLIDNNITGCDSYEQVVDSCAEVANTLTGNVLYDFNNDDCDANDYIAEGILIKAESDTESFTTSTDQEGNYSFVFFDDSYTISVVEESLPDGFSAAPMSQDVVFTSGNNEAVVDFCLTAATSYDDLAVSIFPIEEARPGFFADYLISYENNGTTILNPTITMTFDDTKTSFATSVPTETNISGNTVTWNFTGLQPFQSGTIEFTMQVFTPPTVNGNDILEYTVSVTPDENDVTPIDNMTVFEQIVVNSFDPNDKQVTQGEGILIEEVPNYLDYLVRFQNTGTASAVNIMVTDTLVDNLQWNTLKMVTASHDYRLEVEDGNIVKFIFEDIFLPAEQDDEEGSNGYIAFKIKPQPTLVLGDAVENTANIFFDFNAPIITNTVRTEVVEPLGVNDFNLAESIQLYPNPTNGILNIATEASVEIDTIQVLGLDGKLLFGSQENQIDLSQLASGIYFMSIQTNSGSIVKRVVKQ